MEYEKFVSVIVLSSLVEVIEAGILSDPAANKLYSEFSALTDEEKNGFIAAKKEHIQDLIDVAVQLKDSI